MILVNNKIILKTYNEFWKLERILYKFEGVKLPFPIVPKDVFFFALGEAFILILLKIPGLKNIAAVPLAGHPVLLFCAYPYMIMNWLKRRNMDGKLPHKYFYDMFAFYFLTHKKYEYYRPVKGPVRKKISFKVAYRVETIKSQIELNFEKDQQQDGRLIFKT